jgi:Predicted NTPase (NACHT family)
MSLIGDIISTWVLIKEPILARMALRQWIRTAQEEIGPNLSYSRLQELSQEAATWIKKRPKHLKLLTVISEITSLQQEQLGYGLGAYLEDLCEKCRYWRGLGLRRDIDVENLYISPGVEAATDRHCMGESELLDLFQESAWKLVITGPAGGGKTTLLRNWAIRLAKDRRLGRVPIYLQIRQLVDWDRKVNLATEYLGSVAAQGCGGSFPGGPEALEKTLNDCVKRGCAIILLDGADEVEGEKRAAVRRWLDDVLYAGADCPMAITTRPGTDYVESIPSTVLYRLKEFSEREVIEYIGRWFGRVMPAKADALVGMIKKEHLGSLAANPLFLTMMCVVYERAEQDAVMPPDQAGLFERFARVMVRERDRAQNVPPSAPAIETMSLEDELAILGEVAAKYCLSASTDFARHELEKFVAAHLNRPIATAADWIDHIVKRSALLTEPRDGYCRFSHPKFAAFFVARNWGQRNIGKAFDENDYLSRFLGEKSAYECDVSQFYLEQRELNEEI